MRQTDYYLLIDDLSDLTAIDFDKERRDVYINDSTKLALAKTIQKATCIDDFSDLLKTSADESVEKWWKTRYYGDDDKYYFTLAPLIVEEDNVFIIKESNISYPRQRYVLDFLHRDFSASFLRNSGLGPEYKMPNKFSAIKKPFIHNWKQFLVKLRNDSKEAKKAKTEKLSQIIQDFFSACEALGIKPEVTTDSFGNVHASTVFAQRIYSLEYDKNNITNLRFYDCESWDYSGNAMFKFKFLKVAKHLVEMGWTPPKPIDFDSFAATE